MPNVNDALKIAGKVWALPTALPASCASAEKCAAATADNAVLFASTGRFESYLRSFPFDRETERRPENRRELSDSLLHFSVLWQCALQRIVGSPMPKRTTSDAAATLLVSTLTDIVAEMVEAKCAKLTARERGAGTPDWQDGGRVRERTAVVARATAG